jgi:cysteine desulfurase/selenocysteine lyase
MDTVARHEAQLTEVLLRGVVALDGVRVLGPLDAAGRIGVVSVDVEGIHPHDVGQLLDDRGIAVRVGHHCAQPVHRALGVFASTRASTGIYTTVDDVNSFVSALGEVRSYFGLV